MKVFDCLQGSKQWHDSRRGVPTASRFDMILQPHKCKPSASQDRLINQLIAETYSNIWPEVAGYISPAMDHGTKTESTARARYELETDIDVQQVGFCLSDCGRFGCSPDGLVGSDGGVEIKCPERATHVQYVRDGVLPLEYKAQIHGCLIVTGRAWWDFWSYAENLPSFKIRVYPDDFTKLLHEEVLRFVDKYQAALSAIEEKMR